jgi:hypothetical protein
LVYITVVSPTGERVVRLADDLGREGNRAVAVAAALRLLVELG